MCIIQVNHLTKDYGFGRGVFDVSFKIEKGEVFGFLGPNGAGKSTTIRHLMGFSKPQSGETKIFDKKTFDKYFEILDKVGYIPGEIALPQGLTGWEFIRMMQNLQKVHNEQQLNKMLKLFELEDNVLKGETKRMSLGVKRKLAIVVAFMSDPEVLILDEPTSGLDPVMQEVFINLIKEEKERGKTILLSSHIFTEVDATCDRIAIIKDGKIVSEFVANDLKHAKTKFYAITFKEEKDFKQFLSKNKKSKILSILNSDEQELKVTVMTEDKNINRVVELLSSYEIKEFTNIKETLEDYFMKFYKEDKEFGGQLWTQSK
ncbi:MAG: ATP-binding cassette domain-containing protein [Firmicutes bacterium]|nr:ATP-binding cassette domain-containing protein [Bacillota bacterium]MDY3659332.1 ATP-binding cassette domain-containing protein [Eubacteriales bacterium]